MKYIKLILTAFILSVLFTSCDIDNRLKPMQIEEKLPNSAIEIESYDHAFQEGHFYVIKHKETGKRFLYIMNGGNITLQPLN